MCTDKSDPCLPFYFIGLYQEGFSFQAKPYLKPCGYEFSGKETLFEYMKVTYKLGEVHISLIFSSYQSNEAFKKSSPNTI